LITTGPPPGGINSSSEGPSGKGDTFVHVPESEAVHLPDSSIEEKEGRRRRITRWATGWCSEKTQTCGKGVQERGNIGGSREENNGGRATMGEKMDSVIGLAPCFTQAVTGVIIFLLHSLQAHLYTYSNNH